MNASSQVKFDRFFGNACCENLSVAGYIDDIFFIQNESEEKLEGFLENLNSFHPDLKFISEKSGKPTSFLDVKVSWIDQHL